MLLPDLGTDFPLIPIDIDPPDHARYRRILLPLFSPRAVARLEDGMRVTSRELLRQVTEQEVADVSALYARNTLRQRIQRIEELIGQSPEHFEDAVIAGLAARLVNRARKQPRG
jgi:cytochrome P450